MSIEDDRIEKLKRKLYSRGTEPVLDLRSQIKDDSTSVNNTWGDTSELHIPDDMKYVGKTHPFLKKFLFGAVLFFIVSVLVGGYIYFGGGNLISSSNVDIRVAGPTTIASGEEVDLVVSLVNQNRADLNSARLSIDYPPGASADKDSLVPLIHTEEAIGTIPSGQKVDKIIKLYLLGDKDVVKTLKYKLEYKVKASNAVFNKQKDYDIVIGSSPVILNVNVPKEVNSGQSINFTMKVTSNSPTLLRNVMVVAEYPYGFTFDSSSATATQGNTVWNLGDLKSGDTKTIQMSGKLIAQDGEQRTFKFSVGTKNPGSTKDLDTLLSKAEPTLTVSKPFIDARLSISNSEASSVSVDSETSVSAILNFTNTLPVQLHNVSVIADLSGDGLNRQNVAANNGGFYQSSENQIVWDKNSTPSFTQVNPSESKNVSFSFGAIKPAIGKRNPVINVLITVKGTRTSASGSIDDVSVSLSRMVKLNTNLALVAKSLRGGPITNTGPASPKAEQPSTYTIDWALSNTWNDVVDGRVTTQLPPYVEWTGQVSPGTANIMYNPDSRIVTWTPGSVAAGAGFTNPPKEVFFQVKLNPSLSQMGTVPSLTSNIQVSATDTYTSHEFNFSASPLTTQVSDLLISGSVSK